jgi:branched-chain amino acid transport system ATP-binding protein
MTVVSDVCMTVAPGEIVALLGRNGAGKSTALLATAGTIRPHKGSVVELDGLALHGHRPEAIASRGLALVAQGHRVFPEMTVAENLRIGAFARREKQPGSLPRFHRTRQVTLACPARRRMA